MSDEITPALTHEEWALVRFFHLLAAIDGGRESLTRVSEYQSPGDDFVEAEYVTGSGWRFEVFPDGGMFDYFTWFQTPEGVRHKIQWYDDVPSVVERALWRLLLSYSPNRHVWAPATYAQEPAAR